jgi:hypothetical protein
MGTGAAEIWIVESCWEGFMHAPFNASLVEVVHRAWPECPAVFAAHSTHLAEVRATLPRDIENAVRWIALDEGATSGPWAAYRHIVRRDLHPLRQSWRAHRLLRSVRSLADEGAGWVFASCDASLLGALWLDRDLIRARSGPRPEVVFHGELAAVDGWRSRRPTWRALDLTSSLRRWFRAGGTITVLEEHVVDALAVGFARPCEAGAVKVLPHPTSHDPEAVATGPVRTPVNVGFLGIASVAKGFDTFVRTAERLSDEPNVRFRVAGFRGGDLPDLSLAALHDALPATGMPRAAYEEIVAELDYVCLPLSGDYYRFAASGTVLDAIRYLRPLIALDTPLIRRLVAAAGDIGHVCEDETELEATIRRIARDPDMERHRMQVENLRHLRDRRSPEALALVVADIWLDDPEAFS